MEIARFVYDAGVDGCEYGFRFFTGFEEFDFQFIIRCQGNPFDVVFFQHRVDDRANSDFQFIADAFYDGDVFFFSCINGTDGNGFSAFYAAAEQGQYVFTFELFYLRADRILRLS